MQIHHQLDRLPKFNNAVITIGSFDGLHRGHLSLINRVKRKAKEIKGESVVISFWPHPRKILSAAKSSIVLLNSLDEKIERFKQSGIDHLVIVPATEDFFALSAEAYISDFLNYYFKPAIIVIGYDHKFGAGRKGNVELLKVMSPQFGYSVDEVNAEEVSAQAISSTRIRKAIKEGEITTANELLDYHYPLSGTVVSGQRIGRSIGYPTANVQIDEPDKLLPLEGVYAATAQIESDSTVYNGMLYIGRRPSLDDGNAISIEINIFNFDQDIYGQKIRLELHNFIRKDFQLNGLDALKAQLAKDKIAAEAIFMTPQPKQLSTAIVILNYNGRKYLEEFLPPLIDSLVAGSKIVVADNLSTDDSVAWMKANHPTIELIELPKNYGFAGGYNEALASVEADIYVLLNSDIEVTKNWLSPCLELFQNDETIGACQPKILAYHQKSHFEYAGAAGGWIDSLGYPFCRGRIFTETEEDNGQHDSVEEIFWATGAALFIRSKLFHGLGGFEAEYFAHAEEIDLCWRLKRSGYKVMAQPASTVYHVGGGTLAYKTPKKTYLNFRNTLTTSFKNEPGIKLFWWLPLRLILDGLAGILFFVQGDWSHIVAIIKAHFHIYPKLGFWYKRRQLRKQQIKAMQIGPSRVEKGTLHDSLIIHYYLLGHRRFDQIVKKQVQLLDHPSNQ